jgi:hypothetical protein
MAFTDSDKKAARALIKLGLLDRAEALEWLEGLEEIDYEGGLLALLEDEERISAKERARVERALAGPSREKGKAAAEPAPAQERPRKRRSSRREETQGKGRSKWLLIGGAAAVILVAAVAGFLVLGGGNDTPQDDGNGDSDTPSDRSTKRSPKKDDAVRRGPSGSSAPKAPKPESVTNFAYRFRAKNRIVSQITSETTNTASTDKLHTREEQFLFIASLDTADGTRISCMEHQTNKSTTKGNKDPEKTQFNYFEFLRLEKDGTTESERVMGSETLLWCMAEPHFPPDGKVINNTWTLDRDTREGRFEIEYRLEEQEEIDGRTCHIIHGTARFPGGAPPSSFVLRQANTTIWFDNAEGVIVKAEVVLHTAPAEAAEDSEPTVVCTLSRTLLGVDEIEPQELRDIQQASDFYFAFLKLVEDKKYNKAFTMLEDPDLSRKFNELSTGLIRRIPGIRTSLQAQMAMRKRTKKGFRNIPWRRPVHGAAMITAPPDPKPAKERKINMKGRPAPAWLKKITDSFKGKGFNKSLPTLVYVGFHWLGAAHSTAKMVGSLYGKNRTKFNAFGIVDCHTWRNQIRFLMGVGGRLNHRIVWRREHHIREYNLPGIPLILVLDPGGTVKYASLGWFPDKTEEEVKKALGL